ncbi:MAG: 3-dehydroquinate synthase, partial [Cytophagaceae bacterium]
AEIRSGFAEVIKHCLIADEKKWSEISQKSLEEQDWKDLITHSIKIKAHITEEDPLEKGLRKVLNFGHTIGHAVETYFLNIPGKRLLHGEAIAIGMIAESHTAWKKGFISEDNLNSIKSYIFKIYGHIEIFDFDIEKIIALTLQDKKNEHNAILCTLLEKVGEANYNQQIQFKDIRDALIYYTS